MLNGFLLLIYAVVGHLKQMALFSVPDSMIIQLCLKLPGEGGKKKATGNYLSSKTKGNEKLSLESISSCIQKPQHHRKTNESASGIPLVGKRWQW